MKPIVIIAAWSSGSTAVAGYLDACGGYSCPPHFRTNDTRTPNAYEPLAYQAALGKLFDETSLKEVGKQQDFIVWFDAWWAEQCDEAARQHRTHIVLKQPLQTLLLPFLKQRIDPIFVFVTRPLKDIERTRRRRNWPAVYGAAGADALYKAAFNFLVANGCPYLSIPYDVFRSDPELRRKLIDFVELEPTDEMLSLAEDFLRPAG